MDTTRHVNRIDKATEKSVVGDEQPNALAHHTTPPTPGQKRQSKHSSGRGSTCSNCPSWGRTITPKSTSTEEHLIRMLSGVRRRRRPALAPRRFTFHEEVCYEYEPGISLVDYLSMISMWAIIVYLWLQ